MIHHSTFSKVTTGCESEQNIHLHTLLSKSPPNTRIYAKSALIFDLELLQIFNKCILGLREKDFGFCIKTNKVWRTSEPARPSVWYKLPERRGLLGMVRSGEESTFLFLLSGVFESSSSRSGVCSSAVGNESSNLATLLGVDLIKSERLVWEGERFSESGHKKVEMLHAMGFENEDFVTIF